MNEISAVRIEYKLGNNKQCTLSVLIYAQGFAGMGQVYSYNFQLDNPKPFNKTVHTYSDISSLKKNVSFDMPLISQDGFTGWYFSFKYNDQA